MSHENHLLSVTAIGFALTGSGFAADLPSVKAPIIEPPPPFSWTGLYGGVNIGYGFGNGDRDYGTGSTGFPQFLGIPAWTISNDMSGVLGGGQVGYNHQFNSWLVVGIEADAQATDVHSQGVGIGPAAGGAQGGLADFAYATQNKSVDWFGTLRGRVGVTFPTWPTLMIYGTGGFAYGGVVHSVNASDLVPSAGAMIIGTGGNYDSTRTGWTAGGGVEWFPLTSSPLFKDFSVKLEYLYTDLGSTTVFGGFAGQIVPPGAPPAVGWGYSQTSQTRWHSIRLGVNWHFNPFGPTPVLAKF